MGWMRKEGESFKRLAAEFARVGRILFEGGLSERRMRGDRSGSWY